MYRAAQQDVLDEIRSRGTPVDLAGDGQCDSPGKFDARNIDRSLIVISIVCKGFLFSQATAPSGGCTA